MKPLINWEEFMHLGKIPFPPKPKNEQEGNMWDRSAPMYNQMAKMEKSYTLNQINSFDTSTEDTVLDIGCGPGRISVPMAQRAKSVTSLDSSEKMLEFCKKNASEAGLSNLDARLLDWNEAVLGENLEQHDIVIASRSVGMSDIIKLSSFAKKYAVIVCWANAPSIPHVLGELFNGTQDDDEPSQTPMIHSDRRLGYNITYNMIYDMGYDPNIHIVTDGFTKDFLSKEEAYEDLRKLREISDKKIHIFRNNVDKLLTPNEKGGVTFRRETKSFVCWWSPKTV